MSPAGTSASAPMLRHSSLTNAWQKRITSMSLFPLGEKSEPPFAPPIARVVSEFLNVCSKARNFRIDRFTDEWKRMPPLYGPIALLCCTRQPVLLRTRPWSSVQLTRNEITRSGMHRRSIRL